MRDELGQDAPDLVVRLNAGDGTAGDELFARAYGRLVQLARPMLGAFPDLRRGHDAESLVHDAWIDLQTALRSVKPEGPARYLSLAARKVRLALLDLADRERRRLDSVPLRGWAGDSDDSWGGNEPSAGSSSDPGRLEIWTRFHQAVGELPDELREVFEAYFYTDERPNQAKVAERLGMPARAVSRLIAKAKDRLVERVSGLTEVLA